MYYFVRDSVSGMIFEWKFYQFSEHYFIDLKKQSEYSVLLPDTRSFDFCRSIET